MKKVFLMLVCLVACQMTFAGNTDNQTTEGTDFWVTFLRADADSPTVLSLAISAKEATDVTINNPYTGFTKTLHVPANTTVMDTINKADAYSSVTGKVTETAIQVSATAPISLFASNYRLKSTEAANILPTAALLDEYVISTYPASDHDDDDKPQGTHFAIVAAEDDVVVDYVLTNAATAGGSGGGGVDIGGSGSGSGSGGGGITIGMPQKRAAASDTLQTPSLKKGQVWYVWTGYKDGTASDLTGSYIKARDGKKIAVFMGDPHTNIPHEIRDRDHLYEQAMPTAYWGTSFVVTGSMLRNGVKRKYDILRVTALDDGTELRVDGVLQHTFDFASNPSRTFEMKIQEAGVHYIDASCPCQLYLYMVSNREDGKDSNGEWQNGDPAMVWINPLEQQIEQIQFVSYPVIESSEGTLPEHFVNIVTETSNVGSMTLDGNTISGWKAVPNKPEYSYVQHWLGNGKKIGDSYAPETHVLKGNKGFIAHAYGYGEKEAYAYSVGGKTVPLVSFVEINGEIFSAGEEGKVLCGVDTVHFKLDLSAPVDSVKWVFGDGNDTIQYPAVPGEVQAYTVDYKYPDSDLYRAQVILWRTTSGLCRGESAVDSIPIPVNTQHLAVTIDSISSLVCPSLKTFNVYYSHLGDPQAVDNVYARFDAEAQQAGFPAEIEVQFDNSGSSYMAVPLPASAKSAEVYHADLILHNDCMNDTVNIDFRVNYKAEDVIAQRWNDVLGVKNSASNGGFEFVAYQWYKDYQIMPGETNSYIYQALETASTYYVELTDKNGMTLCSCPMSPVDEAAAETPELDIKYLQEGSVSQVQVAQKAAAKVYDVMGRCVSTHALEPGINTIDNPANSGVYILKIMFEDIKDVKTLRFIVEK